MFSRFPHKVGWLLGLFAILMATLAPTISQALAQSRAGHSLAGMHCSMPAMRYDAPNDRPGYHSAMSHGDACGYCSLLAHMPVVPTIQTPFTITVWATQHRIATRFQRLLLVEALTSARPRAPPVPS
ncbi:DUF2946 domain-containing protein [Pararobbsia alpina]|uniref:DUF2946 domain-containing protein n=1 Tax=Pararobbsia alpina TaxID=621374 RepID=A0A6S7BYP2_9BURK|nr:DUF2946 domain-containing protein [Pararobbsia alpina]CAB3803335.1 hypothetical protein LMG28138_05329 [Pararobbsia alpina]